MTEAKDLRKGAYILHNGEIMQVVRKETVAYGTHSHSKTKLFLRSLLSKGEKDINLMHHDKVEELDITRKAAQVISKMGEAVQIMDSVSYETFDAKIEPETLQEVSEGETVTFIEYNGHAPGLEKRT